jgi:hypothetical protein
MTVYQTGSLALGGAHFEETKRSNAAREAIAREGLRLREYLGQGALDARWTSIEQSYDRMDDARRKEVDAFAGKAAKAASEARYFDELSAGQTDAGAKAQAEASARLKREEAKRYWKQAETIKSRPAPKAQRSSSSARRGADPLVLFHPTPPVSEDEYVSQMRKRMETLNKPFDERRARDTYRGRYGR